MKRKEPNPAIGLALLVIIEAVTILVSWISAKWAISLVFPGMVFFRFGIQQIVKGDNRFGVTVLLGAALCFGFIAKLAMPDLRELSETVSKSQVASSDTNSLPFVAVLLVFLVLMLGWKIVQYRLARRRKPCLPVKR